MTITDNTFEDDMRRIIREEVRPIIREETQDLRDGYVVILEKLGAQSLQLGSLQASMNYANNTLRGHTQEIHRLDVLLEDLNERLATARELRWD